MLDHAPLTDWQNSLERFERVKPWKPHALAHEQWPPDYKAVYAWRMETLAALDLDPAMVSEAKEYYSTRPAQFIMHWMDTYDPRKKQNKWMPFVFFMRQSEFITFLHELREDGENGLVEKCRDAGATWLACGYSVWSWLFIDDDAIGWGSRKAELVDKIGVIDSIFEKMRKLLERIPRFFRPERYVTAHMKFINHDNGSTIEGEGGDNIGRGGRKAIYFKDESAHYERPEKVESALGDNTETQVDISSVNGLGNVFHRRAESAIEWIADAEPIETGQTRKFIIDWRHHPNKTQDWYDRRKAKYEREGMSHVFAQEVDRDYAASVSGAIVQYEWLQACIDAHKTVSYIAEFINNNGGVPDIWSAALDVADEGVDRNALTLRQWIIMRDVQQWGNKDPGETALKTMGILQEYPGIVCQYDSIGIGSNVKSQYNRLVNEGEIDPSKLHMVGWNAGAGVVDGAYHVIPDDDESPLNKNFFGNFKAQGWWALRTRVYKTWRAVKFGDVYPVDELISFDSKIKLLLAMLKEIAQPVSKQGAGLRMIVDKQPDGMKSPDMGDSCMMNYFPVVETGKVSVGGQQA